MKMLTLNSLNITDAGLSHLRKMTRLERLYIYDTPISGSGLEYLTDLKSLKYLLLRGCPITDSGVMHVRQFPSLTLLDLSGSSSSFELQVTSEAIDQLKSALPQLKVNR
jgi:Leucine-rich repeat (LRR) protein